MKRKLPTRREFFSMAGTFGVAGLAGCSGVTDQSFAADAVVLPDSAEEELALAETVRQGNTVKRSGPAGIEVNITNQASLYRRGPASSYPTLMEQYLCTANGMNGPGAAVIAVASELGVDEASPVFLEGDARVSGDRITLVIPEAARSDGDVRLDELMALHHANALPADELTSSGGNNYLLDARQVIPKALFRTGGADWSRSSVDERWTPSFGGGHWIPENSTGVSCLVCLGERSPESVFGVEEISGRPLDPGETVSTENTLLFLPAPKEMPSRNGSRLESTDPAKVFDQGVAAPTGGATFGLAALATPDASVLGQSANPIVHMGTEELLQQEVTRRMLARTGVTDAEQVRWLAGPEEVAIGGRTPFTLLGEETELQGFAGVVSGNDGPWAVLLQVARVTPDDHVITASVIRRPVGSAATPPSLDANTWPKDYLPKYTEFTHETMGRLKLGGYSRE